MNRSAQSERILAVDDSPDTLEVLRRNLTSHGFEVMTAPAVAEAVRILCETPIDVVITDLKMPGGSGMDLIRHVRDNFKTTEILMLTGYPSVEGAVEAVKIGAGDYLSKPFTSEELLTAVRGAVEKVRARAVMHAIPRALAYATPALLGECEAMRTVKNAVEKAIGSTAPVLLQGEQGTGLEAIARSIHYSSALASCPFLAVQCETTPGDRLAAELFGDGSSGPARLTAAQFARGGTLYIDELSCADSTVQAGLLGLVRDKVMPDGGTAGRQPIEVRLVAATSRDPRAMIARGALREDLFYAINVIELQVPPVRERGDDVLLLAHHFAVKFAGEHGREPPTFSDRTLQVLKNHTWPGNLMELENTVQRLVVMADGDSIDVPDLPSMMRFSALRDRGLDRSLADVESEHIRNVVSSVQGNQTRAAHILGIDRKTLREKMKRINRKSVV